MSPSRQPQPIAPLGRSRRGAALRERALVLVLLAVSLLPARALAHEVPAHVTVRAFVKPTGDRLQLLVRVPLESMRDVAIPLRGPGYLDTERVQPLLADAAALWIGEFVVIRENGVPLRGRITAARVSAPSDASFGAYDTALSHTTGPPLPAALDIPWQQALLDVLIEYPIVSDRSDFTIEPALAHLGRRTATVLYFLPPSGGERVYHYTGNPGVVRLDPRWHHAALRFTGLGLRHILGGVDHLLFLLCLVIPFRRLRPLVVVVTAFTVAHSVTLVASALGFAPRALWFPPLVEVLIAASILYMALENIVGARVQRRWVLAFGFGLVHGFGFSFALRESLQFAGAHLATSLLAFNIGVELGQIGVLLIAVPALGWAFRRVVAERVGVILLSAVVAHTAWHWMADRGRVLGEYEIAWPALDAAFLAAALRFLMVAFAGAAVLLALRDARQRRAAANTAALPQRAGTEPTSS